MELLWNGMGEQVTAIKCTFIVYKKIPYANFNL